MLKSIEVQDTSTTHPYHQILKIHPRQLENVIFNHQIQNVTCVTLVSFWSTLQLIWKKRTDQRDLY